MVVSAHLTAGSIAGFLAIKKAKPVARFGLLMPAALPLFAG